jgi:hypothetical protein
MKGSLKGIKPSRLRKELKCEVNARNKITEIGVICSGIKMHYWCY